MSEEKKKEAIGDMLDEFAVAFGWKKLSDSDHKTSVRLYFNIFESHQIPLQHYEKLKMRMINQRISAIAEHREPPRISPELMAAEYIKMKREYAEKLSEEETRKLAEIKAKCERCYGSGFYSIIENRQYTSIKCDHSPLSDEEIAERQKKFEEAREKYPDIFNALTEGNPIFDVYQKYKTNKEQKNE